MSEAATIGAERRLRRNDWGSQVNARRVRKRYAADRRLQAYGLIAIGLAVGLLGILIISIISTGYPAFVQSKADLQVYIDPAKVDPKDPGQGNFRAVVRDSLARLFPAATTDKEKSDLTRILSSDAPYVVRDYVLRHPQSIGERVTLAIPLSDPFDQLHKGVIPREVPALATRQVRLFDDLKGRGLITEMDGRPAVKLDIFLDPALIDPGVLLGTDWAAVLRAALKAQLPTAADSDLDGMLAPEAGELVRERISLDHTLIGKSMEIVLPLSAPYAALAEGKTPMVPNERFAPDQLRVYDTLVANGLVRMPFNWELFFNADSRFPERAGLAGAITGSFYALLVCFLLSFPIGIAAAVYLEEFAPKNRFTDLIEVNINNLAAVPSVVFGLLGLAVFLGFFGLPRSAPLVGGMVLSLMTLPTIIIATRAALKAVPPSIREAALGVGASKHQVMLHHVLPLAMPGILTGTIIGMAQALGETAPLLLIGMNAFIPSIESMGILEPATSLPTQIFSWADSPERGFVSRTSAAILVLLGFLAVMNLIAIVLRHKFERKW